MSPFHSDCAGALHVLIRNDVCDVGSTSILRDLSNGASSAINIGIFSDESHIPISLLVTI